MQEGTTSAQAPQKDSPFIPVPEGQGSSGSGSDKFVCSSVNEHHLLFCVEFASQKDNRRQSQ